MAKESVHSEEAPQAPEDKHGANYDNIATGWVRGAVGAPTCNSETAENKPGFDKSKYKNR